MSTLLAAVSATRHPGHAAQVEEFGRSARSVDGAVAVQVVGTLDNVRLVQAMLEAKGYVYGEAPPLAAEIVAQLVHDSHRKGMLLFHAVRQAVAALSGRYALVATAVAEPECLVVAHQGHPLVIGIGGGDQAVAVDEAALPGGLRRCIALEQGDVAELRGNDIVIVNADGQAVLRRLRSRESSARAA